MVMVVLFLRIMRMLGNDRVHDIVEARILVVVRVVRLMLVLQRMLLLVAHGGDGGILKDGYKNSQRR